MASRLVRRVVSLFAAFAVVALAIAPGVAAADPQQVVVSMTGGTATATEGVPFHVTLGYIDPFDIPQPATFAIHIEWGDGTSQDMAATGMDLVDLTHTYAAGGQYVPYSTYTVTATVTDSQSNSGTGSLEVRVDDVAPVVTAIPATVPQGFQGTVRIASFTDASVAPWFVTVDGGVGGVHQTMTLQSTGAIEIPYSSANGTQTITVTVQDSGAISSSVSTTVTVAVPNVPPTVTATVSNPNPGEPQTVVASATFTDPESATETYTCSILYGDGSAPVAAVVSGMTCTGPAHQYRATGNYAILVTVTDSGGASGAWIAGANYTNYAPTMPSPALFGQSPEVGRTVYIAEPFLDPGSQFETYTCTVDYGDGSGVQTGTYVANWSVTATPACLGPDHVYLTAGNYTIKAVVTDSGGASSSGQGSATITGPVSPTVTAPPDQTVSSQQAAQYSGWYPYALGSFTDPGGAAAGPWYWSVEWDGVQARSGTATVQGPITGTQYLLPGTHRAHVVVRNAAGKTGDAYFNVTVAGDLYVSAAPMVVATEGVPTSVIFGFYDPYLVQSTSYTVHVDFGDGMSHDFSADNYTPMPMSIPHTYAAADATPPGAPGTLYTATITVTDSLGHSGSATRLQPVYDVAPVVTAFPRSVPLGFSGPLTLATFTDASVGPWYVLIDQGLPTEVDLQLQSPGEIQYPYFNTNSGGHTFTVTVWDRGGMHSTVTVPVTIVNVFPVVTNVHFTPSPAVEGAAFTVVATYSEPRNGDYQHSCLVDYGDGSGPQAGSIVGNQCYGPVHNYSGLGPYTAMVAVYNNLGFGTGQATLTIPNDPPVIVSYSIPASTAPYGTLVTASFTDRGSGTSETYSCTIDPGDGSGPAYGSIQSSTCWAYVGYADPGTYTVTIRITDSNGGVATQTGQTSVYLNAPVVNEIAVPATANAGVPIAASATFVPTGRDETYVCTVNYDDGTGPETGVVVGTTCQGPAHIYARSGFPEIAIIVTGSVSGQGWNTADIVVYQDAPSVNLIYAPGPVDEGGSTSALAYFSPTNRDETYTCTIDYGDGAGAQAVPIDEFDMSCRGPDHTYANAGTFTITVTVTASGGSSGSGVQSMVVVNEAPWVTAYSIYSYAPSGEDDPASVIFTDPGFGTAGATETYTCTIDYGDGTGPAAGVIVGDICTGPHHAYASKGTYGFVATVTDSHGGVGTYSLTIEIYNPVPIVGAVSAPATVIRGSSMTASAEFISTGLVPDDTCSVNYGDGSGALAATVIGTTCQGPAHVYAAAGTFQITVTVTSVLGSAATSSRSISVTNPAPVVGAITAPASVNVGASVTASAPFTTSGPPQTYTCTVDYGDGSGKLAGVISRSTCTGQRHVYAKAGSFTITVTVTGSASPSGSASKSITVALPPIVVGAVSAPASTAEGSSVTASATFTATGLTETYTCTVDYGDGLGAQAGTVSGKNCTGPKHVYGRPGQFTIAIAVKGSAGTTGSATKSITVTNVVPTFTKVTIPATVKLGTAAVMSATFTDPGTSETYLVRWTWGDGTTTTATLASSVRTISGSHLYSKSGVYQVNLTLTDGTLDDGNTVYYNSGIAVYDPARTITGSGTFPSPAGSCTVTRLCSQASIGSFSLSASYAKGATKPTVSFSFSAAGVTYKATSADWFVAADGTAAISGTGTLNGVSGYRFGLDLIDGTTDVIAITILDSKGNTVYFNNGAPPLKTGSITIK